jgi:hypothetical protein
MEHEVSLLHVHEPATRIYHVPDGSSPPTTSLLPTLILSSHLCPIIPSDYFPLGFLTKMYKFLTFLNSYYMPSQSQSL